MTSVAALFNTYEEADVALQALKEAGFGTEEITVLARKETLPEIPDESQTGERAKKNSGRGALTGGVVGGLSGLLVGLGSIMIPGLGPIIAGGALATLIGTTAAGAGLGAASGGIVGYLTGLGIPEDAAGIYAEGLKRGGLLIIVETDESRSEIARTVFENVNAVNIDRAAEEWRSTGWVQFDEKVDPDSSYPRMWGGFFSQR
jgi:hypothetical protein